MKLKTNTLAKHIFKILLELLVIALVAMHLFPVFNLITSSFKTAQDLALNPIGFPQSFALENYTTAWETLNYPTAFFNTAFICAISTLFTVLLGACAAYPIARFKLKFTNCMYYVFLAIIMVPGQATLIPLLKMFFKTGLVNTYLGMTIIYVAGNLPFAVFLYTGFIKTIPSSLEEAAIIDGCGYFTAFLKVIFPLLKPVTTTVVILNIMGIWNDFLMPSLILQKKTMRTLTPSIFNFFQEYSTSWNFAFAASVLVMLPGIIIFLCLQKHFVAGMVAGSVKS